MRRGGGHAKGAGFERRIAKLIVKAFKQHGIKQRECWRSVLSGGHIISYGDLEMSDRLLDLFPFSVECKFRKKIRWERYLTVPSARHKSWEEWKWVTQAEEGAAKRTDRNLIPLLVLKENRGPIYAMYESVKDGLRIMPFSRFLDRQAKNAKLYLKVKKGA